jgi:hypothetical protein
MKVLLDGTKILDLRYVHNVVRLLIITQIRNIPPEWRKLFQAAGIKKSELKNKDTAAFVMNVIEQNGGFDARKWIR